MFTSHYKIFFLAIHLLIVMSICSSVAVAANKCIDLFSAELSRAVSPTKDTSSLTKNLYLVHATNIHPKNNTLTAGAVDHKNRPELKQFRPSIHFAVCDLVKPHSAGDWDNMKYAVIIPFDAVADRVAHLSTQDTYILGDLILPKGTIIVENKSNSELTLRDLVRTKLSQLKAYTIESESSSITATDRVQISGVHYTETQMWKAFGLDRHRSSKGGAAYNYEGQGHIQFALEQISDALRTSSKGNKQNQNQIHLYFEAGQILLPEYKKYLEKNNWLSPSVLVQLKRLETALSGWKSVFSDPILIDVANVEQAKSAYVLRALSKEQIAKIFSLMSLDSKEKQLSFNKLLFEVSLLKLFDPNDSNSRFWMAELRRALAGIERLSTDPAQFKEYVRLSIDETAKLLYQKGSPFNQKLLSVLLLPEVIKLYLPRINDLSAFNTVRSIEDYVKTVLIQLDRVVENQRKIDPHLRILQVLGLRNQDSSVIISYDWNNFLKSMASKGRFQSDFLAASKQLLRPLSETDTYYKVDHYTEHSFYRDLYFQKYGSWKDIANRLNLNDQVLVDYPSFNELMKTSKSLKDIIQTYQIVK